MTPMIGKFFPNGMYTFTSSVSFKNEPFSSEQHQLEFDEMASPSNRTDKNRTDKNLGAGNSGQAAVEFAMIASVMLLLLFALIDFGRVLNCLQLMVGLSRQGSNLASRGTSLPNSAAAVVVGDGPLDITHNGEVIITSVTNTNNINLITGQASQGGISRSSRIGTGVGNTASVPAGGGQHAPTRADYLCN